MEAVEKGKRRWKNREGREESVWGTHGRERGESAEGRTAKICDTL